MSNENAIASVIECYNALIGCTVPNIGSNSGTTNERIAAHWTIRLVQTTYPDLLTGRLELIVEVKNA